MYLFRFNEFKFHAAASPGDEMGIARVVQQGHQELPELQRATALVRCALAKNTTPFLLHLTWTRSKETGGQCVHRLFSLILQGYEVIQMFV